MEALMSVDNENNLGDHLQDLFRIEVREFVIYSRVELSMIYIPNQYLVTSQLIVVAAILDELIGALTNALEHQGFEILDWEDDYVSYGKTIRSGIANEKLQLKIFLKTFLFDFFSELQPIDERDFLCGLQYAKLLLLGGRKFG